MMHICHGVPLPLIRPVNALDFPQSMLNNAGDGPERGFGKRFRGQIVGYAPAQRRAVTNRRCRCTAVVRLLAVAMGGRRARAI